MRVGHGEYELEYVILGVVVVVVTVVVVENVVVVVVEMVVLVVLEVNVVVVVVHTTMSGRVKLYNNGEYPFRTNDVDT